MTTHVAFMITGCPNKLEYKEAPNSASISSLKDEAMRLMTENNLSLPKTKEQLRLIYSGKILKDTDKLESLVNPDIEPPITFLVMIRSENAPIADPQATTEEKEKKCKCNVF